MGAHWIRGSVKTMIDGIEGLTGLDIDGDQAIGQPVNLSRFDPSLDQVGFGLGVWGSGFRGQGSGFRV